MPLLAYTEGMVAGRGWIALMLVIILVLIRVYRGAQAPAALARPYDREERT